MSDDAELSDQNKETTTGVDDEVSSVKIALAVFIIMGILGAIANSSTPVSGFIVVGGFFGGIAWLLTSETGQEILEEMKEAQQQQQQNSSSKPKTVCRNCGWKNPKDNNYCHDCGEKLDT